MLCVWSVVGGTVVRMYETMQGGTTPCVVHFCTVLTIQNKMVLITKFSNGCRGCVVELMLAVKRC